MKAGSNRKMEWINNHTVLIVGLGLIGGSYAMALKRIGYHVMAVDIDSETIDYAVKNGIIDRGSVNADEDILGSADCIIMALYPSKIVKWISDNQDKFKEGVIITDVTGIKTSVVYDIQKVLRPDAEFIAAHPMAGRDVYGTVCPSSGRGGHAMGFHRLSLAARAFRTDPVQ